MKMIRFNLLAVIFFVAVLLTGCKKTGNYYDVIPAEMPLVMGFNMQNIMQKGDMQELLRNVLVENVSSASEKATAEKVGQFFTEPQASGLSLDQKTFVFTNSGARKTGCVAKVSDEAKVTEFFEILRKEGKCGEVEKKAGYKQVRLDDKFFAYNAQTLLFYSDTGNDQAEKQLETMMNPKPEESIVSKEGFQKILSMKGDVCYYMMLGNLYQHGLKDNPFAVMIPGIDISKLDLIGNINFENGKVAASVEYFSADATLMEIFKKQAEVCGKTTNVFLPYFPASTLAYGASNMNGAKYWKFAEEYKLFENLKVPKEMVDLQKLLESINGEIAFGVTGMSAQGMPSIVLYAEVTDDYPVKLLAGLEQQFGAFAQFSKKGQNAYEVAIPMMQITFWFGIYDKFFYLTNDAGIYANIGKNAENPLSNNEVVVNVMANSYGGYFLNFVEVQKLQMVQALGTDMNKVFSMLDYMGFSMLTPQVIEGVITVKDQSQNILKTGIEVYKEISK